MKKLQYIIPVLVFFLTTNTFSQHKRTKVSKDKIEAYKIAYLTEKLNLNEKEAKQFWPIYNHHHSDVSRFIKDRLEKIKKKIGEAGSVDNLDEREAEVLMNLSLYLEKKKYEAHKEYISKLQKVLTNKKILKLQIAEREFRRHLFEKMRKRRKVEKEKK